MTTGRLPNEVLDEYFNAQFEAFQQARSGKIILDLIHFCALQEVPPPKWAVDVFIHCMNEWYSLRCATLDEAFGVSWPKGKHLAAARKRRRLEVAVYLEVERLRNTEPVNADLFAKVGKKFAIGKTLAEEYYRSARILVSASPNAFNKLLLPHMSPEARRKAATRKISPFSGSG